MQIIYLHVALPKASAVAGGLQTDRHADRRKDKINAHFQTGRQTVSQPDKHTDTNMHIDFKSNPKQCFLYPAFCRQRQTASR